MEETRLRRASPWFGVVATVVTTGAIGVAIGLSPSFAVTENALSNLGVASHGAGTATTALVFNGGLILGGAFGAVFGLGLAAIRRHPVERLGGALFAVSLLSMAGVGVFPQDGPYHFEVAAGFYLLFSVAVVVTAAGQILSGRRRDAGVSALAGAGNLAAWVGWTTAVGIDEPGLAIPELIGAAFVILWVLWTVRGLRSAERRRSPEPFAWDG